MTSGGTFDLLPERSTSIANTSPTALTTTFPSAEAVCPKNSTLGGSHGTGSPVHPETLIIEDIADAEFTTSPKLI